MKKKTNIKTIIRQIVREEVAMAIQEVITELKQPTQQQVSQPKPKKKIVEKKKFSKNSVLNDLLNETATADDWKTMGGGTFDSGKVNQVMSSQYGDMMSDNNADVKIASMGKNPDQVPDHVKDALVKDYSAVLKASQEKSKNKQG